MQTNGNSKDGKSARIEDEEHANFALKVMKSEGQSISRRSLTESRQKALTERASEVIKEGERASREEVERFKTEFATDARIIGLDRLQTLEVFREMRPFPASGEVRAGIDEAMEPIATQRKGALGRLHVALFATCVCFVLIGAVWQYG